MAALIQPIRLEVRHRSATDWDRTFPRRHRGLQAARLPLRGGHARLAGEPATGVETIANPLERPVWLGGIRGERRGDGHADAQVL